jgi:hypothetical protein
MSWRIFLGSGKMVDLDLTRAIDRDIDNTNKEINELQEQNNYVFGQAAVVSKKIAEKLKCVFNFKKALEIIESGEYHLRGRSDDPERSVLYCTEGPVTLHSLRRDLENAINTCIEKLPPESENLSLQERIAISYYAQKSEIAYFFSNKEFARTRPKIYDKINMWHPRKNYFEAINKNIENMGLLDFFNKFKNKNGEVSTEKILFEILNTKAGKETSKKEKEYFNRNLTFEEGYLNLEKIRSLVNLRERLIVYRNDEDTRIQSYLENIKKGIDKLF